MGAERPPAGPPQHPDPVFDALARAREILADKPPLRRTLTPGLIKEALGFIGRGTWPHELPRMLGVPMRTWSGWLRNGTAHLQDGRDTDEAELVRELDRARAALATAYREMLTELVSRGKGHQGAAWLLSQLCPGLYHEKVQEEVTKQVDHVLACLNTLIKGEDFEALVQLLEGARSEVAG